MHSSNPPRQAFNSKVAEHISAQLGQQVDFAGLDSRESIQGMTGGSLSGVERNVRQQSGPRGYLRLPFPFSFLFQLHLEAPG